MLKSHYGRSESKEQRSASAAAVSYIRLYFYATTSLKLMTDVVSDSMPGDPAVIDVYTMLLNWFRGVSGVKSGPSFFTFT